MTSWKTWINLVLEWIKERLLWCLIVANIVFVSMFGIQYALDVSDLAKYEFTQEQLQQYTGGNCIGASIDPSRGTGFYDVIPDIFLEKGHYSYTIQYEGAAANSYFSPYTQELFFDIMEQEKVDLTGEKAVDGKKFWLNADLNIAMKVYYSGVGTVAIKYFAIEETSALANIELFSKLVLLAGVNLLMFLVMREKKKPISTNTKYSVAALIAVAFIASIPALTGYMVDGHDLRFHLARIESIREGLLAGQFPVRIAPVFYNGYGYASPVFYGELFLYFPGLLRVIGFSVAESYNAFIIAMNMFTAFICYYCGKKMFSNDVIAVTMALLYTLSPYRLMDLYTRAAIGEVTAMTFLPLVAYGLYRILTEDMEAKSYKHAYVPLMLGLTGIIQSHTLTGEMTGGVILLACGLCVFRTFRKKRFLTLVKTVVATVLVNAWFLVPFVDFSLTQDVRVFATLDVDLIQRSGVFLPQIFALFSDFSQMSLEAAAGMGSEMPLGMGLALGLGMLLFATMLWVKKDEERVWRRSGLCFFLLAVIVTYMTTFYFPWDRISTSIPLAGKLISSIQFVWRFMGIAAALATVVTGFGLLLLYKKEGQQPFLVAAVVLAVLAVVSATDYTQDTVFNKAPMEVTENTFTSENNTYYAMAGEYVLCDQRYEIVTTIFEPQGYDGVQVTEYEKNGTSIQFSVTNDGTDGYVYLPLLNYSGYTASSEDGMITRKNLQMGENAVIRVNIPANYAGTISVKYTGMWYWRVAELISVAAVAYLIWGIKKKDEI